jgi:stearoyl-CoA desaturase (delta-9 desaturase)
MLSLFLFCLAYYLLAGVGINLGYHRVLSHRAAQLPKWLERFAITLGLPAGTPIQWAGNHRFHHGHTDVPGDPHSPHLDGIWFAHVGWYIQSKNPLVCFIYCIAGPLRTLFDSWYRPRTNQQFNALAPDVARDRYYRFVSRPWPYFFAMWLHTLIFFGAAYIAYGWIGIAALWVTLALIYNLGDAIDSMAHLIGTQPYRSIHQARNHWLLGLLALGEGWHANHHEFPHSARHGLLPGQPDVIWRLIRTLEHLGLATSVQLPAATTIENHLAT